MSTLAFIGTILFGALLGGWIIWQRRARDFANALDRENAWKRQALGGTQAELDDVRNQLAEAQRIGALHLQSYREKSCDLANLQGGLDAVNHAARCAIQKAEIINELFTNAPVDPVDWKQEDVEEFRKFLKSESGAKFQRYLQRLEQSRNRYAVQHFPHEPAMTGTAKGFGQCLGHVISLSADVRPQQQDIETDAPLMRGESELREMYTP